MVSKGAWYRDYVGTTTRRRIGTSPGSTKIGERQKVPSRDETVPAVTHLPSNLVLLPLSTEAIMSGGLMPMRVSPLCRTT